MHKRKLVLEDGTVFIGKGFGSKREVSGEMIFNTSMTGYQEIITDPAYYGQILLFTNPSIGNYGINRDDFESVHPFVKGIIVKKITKHPSNFRADESLDNYLSENDIPGIAEIDTRKLMRHLRKQGTLKGCITNIDTPTDKTIKALRETSLEEKAVNYVATEKPYVIPGRGRRLVVIDLGMKHGILRSLTNRNCDMTVVPYNYTAEQILRLKPEGIVMTSGPGNPNDLQETISLTKNLLGKVPLFAIGMGLQIFALALGARVNRMFLGHSGSSYPVKDFMINKTFMTSQNHQYEVTRDSLKNTDLDITHINIHDDSIEGLRHKKYDAMAVQFYPESTPGSEDATYLFDQFFDMMNKEVKTNA